MNSASGLTADSPGITTRKDGDEKLAWSKPNRIAEKAAIDHRPASMGSTHGVEVVARGYRGCVSISVSWCPVTGVCSFWALVSASPPALAFATMLNHC
ncbi:MAG: hypothetical protein ACYCWN_06400 [Ferrimicrobium sp.]